MLRYTALGGLFQKTIYYKGLENIPVILFYCGKNIPLSEG